MVSFYNKYLVDVFIFLTTFFNFFFLLEIKVIVDVEKNNSQPQEIRTLAKFEFSIKNIILELFKEGPDKVIYLIKITDGMQ